MIKEKITYTDYDDVERTETFMFNITETEAATMELSVAGGISAKIQRLVEAQEQGEIIKVLKDFILMAYGVKTPDGRRFEKTQELRDAFEQNPAFSILFMKLATDAAAAAVFVNGLVVKKASPPPQS